MTLKLNQPSELSDFERGGGPMIRQEIVSGEPGNLFPKLSRRARAAGDVSLRELFTAYETADDSTLLDAGLAVVEPPQAEGVEVVLFAVPDRAWTYREDAVAYVEAYTQAGQEMDWRIYGSHLQGMTTLRLWGLPSSRLPSIGDGLFVSDETIGEEWIQPLRITGLTVTESIQGAGSEHEIPFLDALLELSAPLDHDINGQSGPGFSLPTVDEKARRGQVVDNARYHGVAALTQPTVDGEVDVYVDDVFASIVPASRSSTAIIDAPCLPQTARVVVSGPGYEYTDAGSPAHTGAQQITGANRIKTVSLSLTPLPSRGTFSFSYRALGEWYELRDNGDGTVGGPGLGGTGTVATSSGTVSLTLEYLPDLDTWEVWSWGSWQQWTRIDGMVMEAARIEALLDAGSEPATLALSWQAGGVNQSASDNGSGQISGDASGSYSYADGRLIMPPDLLPDGDISYTLSRGAAHSDGPASGITISGGRVLFTAAGSLPIVPGSAVVVMYVAYQWPGSVTYNPAVRHAWIDQGDGTLKPLPGLFAGHNGSIEYSTGDISMPEIIADFTTALRWTGGGWSGQSVTARYLAGNAINVATSRSGGADATTGTLSGYALTIPMPPGDAVQAGSVVLRLAGQDYDGSLGEVAADADGNLTISDWTGGGANAPALLAGLLRGGEWSVTQMHWHALGSPLQSGSLSMVGTAIAGGLRNAGTDTSGGFTGDATGTADFESGYNDTTWSEPMNPATITHSGVVLQLIPVDKALIGIDSARLPADGRVPKFHEGGQLAIGDQVDQVLPAGLVAGQVVQLDQTVLSTVELRDQLGVIVDTALFSVELDTGVLTMAEPLDLGAYTEPLIAALHWDDQATVINVQANGIVTLAAPLARQYAPGTARVYSLLEFGDLRAHVPIFFDQKTWTGVFSDSLNGDPAPFTYNVSAFPVEVDNDQAPAERWALHFVSTSTVEVIGEVMGNIGQFGIAGDISPVDPATGLVVFTLRAGGWGGGAAAGNVLRLNVSDAAAHGWALRCTHMGAADIGDDQAVFAPRGDL